MHGREILVVLLAVQDQADVDPQQAQQAALVGIVVGDGGEEGDGRRDGAVAGGLRGGLVVIDRILFADRLAEQPDLAGFDRGRERLEGVADMFLVEHGLRVASGR